MDRVWSRPVLSLELLKIEVFPGHRDRPRHRRGIFPTGKSPRHTFATPCTVIETFMMYASYALHQWFLIFFPFLTFGRSESNEKDQASTWGFKQVSIVLIVSDVFQKIIVENWFWPVWIPRGKVQWRKKNTLILFFVNKRMIEKRTTAMLRFKSRGFILARRSNVVFVLYKITLDRSFSFNKHA